MSILLSPLNLRGLTARNRLWVAPMCQYSAVDGVAQEWHHTHLAQFASGGAGIVIAEATAVSPDARISPDDTGLWNDAQAAAWAPIVAAIRARGALAGVQLAHAGRKASTWSPFSGHRGSVPADQGGWTTVAPSALAFDGFAEPIELDAAAIDAIVQDFASAAVRATAAGFQLLEIHAAHGYLLHQFLSPLSNRRTDAYGGSLENRARLLLEIVRGVRAEVGDDVPVLVRFSATDYVEGGWDVEQTATVAGWAQDAGADLFDISSGGLVTGVHIPSGPGYQVPFAESVASGAGVRVSAVGRITEPRQAADLVASGQVDAVMLGREMLRDPHFALRAATELGVELDYWPPQYLRARP